MYQVIVGDYSRTLDTMYHCVYMLKEICPHVAKIHTGASGTISPSAIHSAFVVCIWITLEIVWYTMMVTIQEDFIQFENLVYIVRLTPLFYMACLTLLS